MTRSYKSNDVSRTWGFLVGIFILPVFFVFAHYGDPSRGLATCIFLCVIAVVARLRWDANNAGRQMIAILTSVVIHLPLIWFIRWPLLKGPGIALLPIGLLDFLLVSWIFKFAGNSEGAKAI
jgi:hypothetical protein